MFGIMLFNIMDVKVVRVDQPAQMLDRLTPQNEDQP